MKNLIIAFVANALVSTAAFAAISADMVVAEIKPFDQNIQAVQLLESGLLKVIKTDDTVVTMQLSPSNKQQLSYKTQTLLNAEITTVHSPIVCMMMPGPGMMKSLYVNDGNGNLKVVRGPKGCFIHEHIYPADEYTRQSADAMVDQLSLLANQAAGF